MNRRLALRALADAFHGRLAAAPDWMALIEAANRALVTPGLRRILGAGEAPEDAAAFMNLVDERNNARNGQLRGVALNAVAALNGAGVTPVYLKGMAVWAACGPARQHYPRMMSDVDLLVRPEEADRALEALLAGGFNLLERHSADNHGVADLWREGDVGVLDLHRRPPGPAALAALFDPGADTRPVPWPGSARAPSPTHQIYLTCLHDMFHDGGFWRGGFDVRHLCDIADLARHPEGVNWDALRDLMPTRLVRNAVFSQLIAAHRLVGAPIPADIRSRIAPRLHYRRHEAQYLHPQLSFPLALIGIGLEGLNLRQYWPFLGADGMTVRELLWWLSQMRPAPNKI